MPGYQWLNEEQERSDDDIAYAEALAERWTEHQRAEEHRHFAEQDAIERGDYDVPTCNACEGSGINPETVTDACPRGDPNSPCPACNGDGNDQSVLKAMRGAQAARDLELAIIEELMLRHGIRIMRPYEHWNEDERLMEWMERER